MDIEQREDIEIVESDNDLYQARERHQLFVAGDIYLYADFPPKSLDDLDIRAIIRNIHPDGRTYIEGTIGEPY